jgi:hypothetical protein
MLSGYRGDFRTHANTTASGRGDPPGYAKDYGIPLWERRLAAIFAR